MADQQQQQQFQQPQQQQAPRYQPQQQQQQQHLAGGHLQQQQQKLDTGPAPPQTASQVYASIPRAATSSGPAGGLGGPSAVGSSQQVGHLGPSAGQPMQHSAFQQPQQQQQPSQPVYHQYRIPPQTQLQSQHPQQQPLQQHQHVLHIDPILQGPSLAPPHQSHPTGGPSEHDGSSSVNISSSANGVGTSSASGGAGASSSSTGGGGKKKRAPPTRWFAADDAAMVRVLLTEKRLGHETEHGFLASSWERVVEAVQETTLQGQKKDVQPCKDRYKLMIRTLYQPFKELMMHPDFHWSEAEQRFHASADAWTKQIEVNPFAARYKSHSFPLFIEFEELVGYRRQAQLGQQLLHVHDQPFSHPHSQVHTHEGSPTAAAAGGVNGGSFGDHLAGLGMGGMEESFMRVDDVGGNEDGTGGLLGSVLDESYQHSMAGASSSAPGGSQQQLQQPALAANNKRAYAAVSTTSLANAAALGVSGIGPPIKRPYFGPSSSTSSIPSSHQAPPLASGPGPVGSGASHIVAGVQQQLANLDPALSAFDTARTLADIQSQLRELLTLVRRGVEIGEQVLAALPPGLRPSSSSLLGTDSGSTNGLARPDEEVDHACRRDSNDFGGGRSSSDHTDSQQQGPSAPPPSDPPPPLHEVDPEFEHEATAQTAAALANDDDGHLTEQALMMITATPYLGPAQKAALVERAGWDRDFVGDLLHSAADHGDTGGGDEDELRRQLLENALQTLGGL